MVTWIKFSERQPEKKGYYLYSEDGEFVRCLHWSPEHKEFWDPYTDDGSGLWKISDPDYWAEITPPLVRRPGYRMTMSEFFERADRLQSEWEAKDRIAKETPMPEKPLCKDCRFIATGLLPDPLYPKCGNPKAPHSLVTGEPNYRCESLRGDFPLFDRVLSGPRYREEMTAGERQRLIEVAAEELVPNPCGPEGKWFEAKEENP